MNKKINVLQNSIMTTFIYIFIVTYFLFLLSLINSLYGNPEIPLLIFFSFTLIIIVFFYFFIKVIPNEKNNEKIINFKVFNENFIKFILILLMCIFILIPPIRFTNTVMDWNQISFLNYCRAIIILIGSIFLPGACIFNLFFPKSTLHERFNIEPFLIKITIYPLLSFTFLGTSTLILDKLGLIENYFCLFLFLIILILYVCDFLIQIYKENKNMIFKHSDMQISKYSFLILILVMCTMITSLGIILNTRYPIVPDEWSAIWYANHIGHLDYNPSDKYDLYALYWGYLTFGLSILSGIPFINTNFMLFPFTYLIITSVYLFMKALLKNFREIYPILATFFLITFSGLFLIINTVYFLYQSFFLIFNGVLYFNYKSLPIYLLFTSLALLLIVSKTTEKVKTKLKVISEDFLVISLGAWFLIQSVMLYFLPIITAFSFSIIFNLFNNNKNHKLKYHFIYWIIFVLFFFFFDILSDFYFSRMSIQSVFFFIEGYIPYFEGSLLLNEILFYIALFSSYFLFFYTFKISLKFISKRKKKHLEIKLNQRIVFTFILLIFTSLFIIYIFLNKFKTTDKNFFNFYLNIIFFNIGFVGLLGIYLSYFCYKKSKQLFFILLFWFIFLFGFASILIFIRWMEYPSLSPQGIPRSHYFYMMYWFDRNWSYSIVPISALSSIGTIEFRKFLKSKKLFGSRNRNFKKLLKLMSTSFIIFFTLSNTIINGLLWYNMKLTVSDNEAQIIGWVSENIPRDSNILIDRGSEYSFKLYLDNITFCNAFFIDNEVKDVIYKIDYKGDFIYHLKLNNISFYIYSKDDTPQKRFVQEYFNIEKDIIEGYYKVKLYEYNNLVVYSTKVI